MTQKILKLGFQGWFLTEPYTGIGKHCRGLLQALAKEKNLDIEVLVPAPVKVEGVPTDWFTVLKPKKSILQKSLQKAYWERVQVPAHFAKKTLDWEYYPYPCPLPVSSNHKRAMTVHDLILWEDPRYKGGKLKARYHRASKRALIHVDQIFTVSHSVHQELGIPTAEVLLNAVTPTKTVPRKTKKSLQKVLLYLGGYDVRKRVPELVNTFIDFQKTHPEFILELIGSPLHTSKLYPAVPKHSAVQELGSLSEKELAKKLQKSWALLHGSDSEGFNLPLLEAMQAGLPAVVRDIPVNQEVSGGKALFWNPSKKTDLSRIMKTLEDPRKRKAVISAQKKVSRKYSWEKSAKLLLKTLTRTTRP